MTGRRTTRATRQTASIEQETALPSPRHQMSSQPRHPIARRGTRRTQLSRRSVSVDHLKSSGIIGYDEGDDEEPANVDGDVLPQASQDEGSEDAQTVLNRLEIALPRLIRACDEMHAFFERLGVDEPTDKQSIELSFAKDGYNVVLEGLGVPKEEDYIHVSSFPWSHTSYLGTELAISPLDAARRSNLVSLLSMLTDLSYESRDTDELTFFENLDGGLPAYFVSPVSAHDALELAFRVRCHHFSSTLEQSDKPVLVAASIFCGEDFTNQTAARQRLATGPYRPILGLDVNSDDAVRSQFVTYMLALLDQALSGKSVATQSVQNSVEALLPRADLLEDLRVWALQRYHESTTSQSATDQVPPAADQLPNMMEHESEDSDSSDDSDGPVDILLGVSSTGNYMDGTATTHPVKPVSMASSVSATTSTQQKLQWSAAGADESSMLGDEPYAVPSRPPAASSERGIGETDQDVDMAEPTAATVIAGEDDDDEFEENTAAVDQARRVPIPRPARLSRPLPSQARQSPPVSTQPRPRVSSSSYAPPTQPMATQESISPSQMEELRNEAQLNRRAYTFKAEQRRRIPWSQTDEERLIVLIRDFNCVWSQIAEIGGFETYRDQQAVRDKARNMKVVFLSTDQLLPEKFDKVALSRKEREAVRRAGRNPDRKEDDVDDHDQPTNTLDAGLE